MEVKVTDASTNVATPRLFWLIAAIGQMCTLGCNLNPLPVDTSSYKGEGAISRIPFLPNQGVRIDFEAFSMATPYRRAFRIDGLPRHSSGYKVGFIAELESPLPKPSELSATRGGL